MSGRLFISGVQARRIMVIRDGREQTFAELPDGLSPLGMGIDVAAGRLWVAAASMTQSDGATASQQGHSALLAFDMASGALSARYDAPPVAGGRALNDIAIGPDRSVYASDANDGSIFRLSPGAPALAVVGRLGLLKSPQGMVVSAGGGQLLTADYAAGLVTLNIDTGRIRPVSVPRDVTTVTLDGLDQLADGSFVATQNGIHPARLVHFRLSPTGAEWSPLRSLPKGRNSLIRLS
ncbi:MAG TPA: hypothetical protein VHY35_03120 [Stellaceae bacterium]|jgi:sugar lactone lactonase YvrE|nr:hypothetical protein [Stellaceae bacterium]